MYRVTAVDAFVTHVDTRIPFRYGIAEMTKAPHVVVQVTVEHEDRSAVGWASEHLPPKWFTKDPHSAYADDVRDMVRVIEHAVELARGVEAASAFDLWMQLDAAQAGWAQAAGVPGLVSSLGTALVERATIDAVCRVLGITVDRALKSGALGFDAARVHPELAGQSVASWFPAASAESIAVRHTVGLSDALVDEDVVDAPHDALPVSLESVIRRYGVTHFKVKTAGDLEADLVRLARILDLLERLDVEPWFTIDGNESMTTAEQLVTWVSGLLAAPRLGTMLRERLIAVEQPFHRSIAMGPEVASALSRIELPVIIDESDEATATVREAMDLGYAGGTYKGCKGVFRGLANAALVSHRRRFGRAVLTAEDLSSLPPLTVNQDLVVASMMGLTHIERNGHHYFGRLAPLDDHIEERVLAAHPDAFVSDDGRVRLRIDGGRIATASMLAAPFGLGTDIHTSGLAPLSAEAAIAGLPS